MIPRARCCSARASAQDHFALRIRAQRHTRRCALDLPGRIDEGDGRSQAAHRIRRRVPGRVDVVAGVFAVVVGLRLNRAAHAPVISIMRTVEGPPPWSRRLAVLLRRLRADNGAPARWRLFARRHWCGGAAAPVASHRDSAAAHRLSPRTFHGVGVTLTGWDCAAASRRGTLIYLHGVADNRASGAGVVQRYVSRGFDVIAFDSRAHGQSSGDSCTYGYSRSRT